MAAQVTIDLICVTLGIPSCVQGYIHILALPVFKPHQPVLYLVKDLNPAMT